MHTTAAAIQVRTGPLSFTVSRDRFALLEQVQLQGRPVLPAQRLWVMDADGTIYDTAQADAREVVIEERSARRVVIRARGCHASTTGRPSLRVTSAARVTRLSEYELAIPERLFTEHGATSIPSR